MIIGLQPAQSLHEDYPHISLYLRSLTGEAEPAPRPADDMMDDDEDGSSSSRNPNLDAPTDHLLLRVKEIMEASERGELSAEETDSKLREIVEEAVTGSVSQGRALGGMETGTDGATGRVRGRDDEEEEDMGVEDANGDRVVPGESVGKRRREDEPGR